MSDLAHVGPIELYTPVLEQSRDFFVNILALREVHRDETSVYLHTWDDYQSWTVRLIQRDTAGIGRTYLRATSPHVFEEFGGDVATGVHNLGPVRHFTDPDEHEPGPDWAVHWD